ncbi:hypothetical protein FIV42_10530 [Persicimonas caeni]|uniref:Reverse transcriptase domain-containing protein n=1 Tax=Persicimonas caeni TaxID=2292766 RepID=A0A4Y6PS53_PERCE|nr:hypothetical protein [Persicimonas caeni]QDG51156.1 hypothetical protein FIV42_10530 [Persicimonas caeni]QED32377.1 hypothetical protein FRD00_10525 [Persicimonas caeni]
MLKINAVVVLVQWLIGLTKVCVSQTMSKQGSDESSDDVSYLLSHPLVLHAAWRKLQSWYRFGEIRNEADFIEWQLAPESRLEELGKELATGTYEPSLFPLVPYPKKGGMLRHYTAPRTKDQVAFIVFGVLLAPVMEAVMPNFSFGNRWFRGIFRDNREAEPKWKDRGFSLSDSRLYQPYARAFGLYRRVAHWSTAAKVSAKISQSGATGDALTPDDYPYEKLPPFVREKWWGRYGQGGSKKAYWTSLDLRLAFPTVCIEELRNRFRSVLCDEPVISPNSLTNLEHRDFGVRDISEATSETMTGYPADIRSRLETRATCQRLADTLCDLLQKIRYRTPDPKTPLSIWDDCWKPPHITHELPIQDGSNHPGLPTGLALSNFLLNVYLTPLDWHYLSWLDERVAEPKPDCSIFLRFADDMLLVAPSRKMLLEGIDMLWEGIAAESKKAEPSKLGEPGSNGKCSNLRLNWAKIGPEPVKEVIDKYLEDGSTAAKQCDECEEFYVGTQNPDLVGEQVLADGPAPKPEAAITEEEPAELKDTPSQGELTSVRADDASQACPGLSDWFKDADSDAFDRFNDPYGEHVLRKEKLGPFVTYLVERMSDLSREGFEERFGQPARDRLVDLHELIRFDFDDEQVREDTRRAFAANRLVRAWLPEEDVEEDSRQILEIRRSVRQAMFESPWKFSLWRAVIRAAVRRPMAGEYDALDERERATEWLIEILNDIRLPSPKEDEKDWQEDWAARWYAGGKKRACGNDSVTGERVHLVVSFLRAHFWSCLGQAIAALRYEELRRIEAADPSTWSPLEKSSPRSRSWLFRAVPSSEIPRLLEWLGDFDRWAEVLYPGFDVNSPWGIRPWEASAICQAVLAATTRATVARSCIATVSGNPFLTIAHAKAHDELSELRLPDHEALFQHQGVTRAILRQDGRLVARDADAAEINPWVLLKLVPSPDNSPPAEIQEALAELGKSKEGIALARRLGWLLHVPAEAARSWYEDGGEEGKEPQFQTQLLTSIFEGAGGEFHSLEAYHALHTYADVRLLLHSLNLHRPGHQTGLFSETKPTVHRVLWGRATSHDSLTGWRLNLPEAAAIGLPMRIALAMFREAISAPSVDESEQAHASEYPPTWLVARSEDESNDNRLHNAPEKILAQGRRHQRGESRSILEDVSPKSWIATSSRPEDWEILPHPLYFLPLVLKKPARRDGFWANYETWVHALHFFVCVEGSERFLDRVFDNGFGVVPFADRWWLRRRVHLTPETWRLVEALLRWLEDGGGELKRQQTKLDNDPLQNLIDRLDALDLDRAGARDFLYERVDVRLEANEDFEEVRSICGFPPPPVDKRILPEKLRLGSLEKLADELPVRIGQIDASPDWSTLRRRFPALSRREIQEVCHQIWSTAMREADGKSTLAGSSEGLIVFPELVVPTTETGYLRSIVRQTGRSVLAGLVWSPLRCVTPPHVTSTISKRFLVNEAVLIVPMTHEQTHGYRLTREFRIRKPTPAHLEHGFTQALNATIKSSSKKTTSFEVLPGRKWYRFLHPKWGDFSVGICADLLDPTPWMNLRGEVLHLVLSAFNKDVDLYDKLSWVRAYESYANVVVTNHGSYGGSFAWSPRHSQRKEIARIRGNNLHVVADVEFPVRALKEAQQNGVEWAVERSKRQWMGETLPDGGNFKSPPPGFGERDD